MERVNTMGNDFKNRALESKPRERIERAGSASVASAAELLAIIIKTGTAGCDVMELSRRLIDAFGSAEALVKTDLNTLRGGIAAYNAENPNRRITGLGRVKTLQLAAAFELARRGYAGRSAPAKAVMSSADAAVVFRAALGENAEKERFWALPLDTKRRPLSEPQVIAVGTLNGVNVHPRDVFSLAVRWNAHSIVVAHNHPSGSPQPSKRDIELTWGLYGAGKMMGIPLLDHVIVTEKSHYSFADSGRLGEKNCNLLSRGV
jgi:DNA repair protein RadC